MNYRVKCELKGSNLLTFRANKCKEIRQVNNRPAIIHNFQSRIPVNFEN